MKTKKTMTICPVKCTLFTRIFASSATIDKNRSDFFAETKRSCHKSRRSRAGIPPVRGAVARASCPCPVMAKMTMPRAGAKGRARGSSEETPTPDGPFDVSCLPVWRQIREGSIPGKSGGADGSAGSAVCASAKPGRLLLAADVAPCQRLWEGPPGNTGKQKNK